MSAGDYDDYNQEEDEDDLDFSEGYEASKAQIVLLIDASEPAFQAFIPRQDDGAADTATGTYFSYSVEIAKNFLKARVFATPGDEIALMFYGTKVSKNASNLDHVYTFLELDQTDATRVKQLEELTDDYVKEQMDTIDEGPGLLHAEALRNGLWAAGQVLSNKTKSQKIIFLMTRDDNPTGGSAAARANALVRAEELKYAQVSLQLYPLPTPGKLFDLNLFWKDLLQANREGEDSKLEVPLEYEYLENMASQEASGDAMDRCMVCLDTLVRRKIHAKRRAVSKLRWTLLGGTAIALQVYNLVQVCAPPKHIQVHAISNAMLRSDTRKIDSETGAMLTDQDKVTVFIPPKPSDRFPANVRMSRDVVAAVKAVTEPGLQLLGFKPRAYLRDYHQVGKSSFLRPNEGEVRGSITAFKALLDAMVREDKIAICRYRRGKSSDARLVALQPQLEVKDMFQVQVYPEGMHMFQLPFMDDIRAPEKEISVIGPQVYRANPEQVAKAAALMDALSFPKDEATGASVFDCEGTSNPFLFRAQWVIECRAMGQEIPPLGEGTQEWDATQPDIEGIERKHEEIQAYMDSVYGPGANPDGAKGTKRKSEAAAPKSADAAEAYLGFDWPEMAGRAGGLEKLTIKDLKVYLQQHKLPVSGNKAELCGRIRQHLQVDFL